jgi:carbonic anhydrase
LAHHADDQVDWRDTRAPLPSNPALSLAILTCMDARLDIWGRLGISSGDAHILRNAGGRVTPDVIRSLHLSVGLMNVREIGILHHTNCGLEGTDNESLAKRIGVSTIDFLPFQSFHDSLRADMEEVLKAGVLPAGGIVWGGVYTLGAEKIKLVHGPVEVTQAR